jgi:hypothetical protein
MTTHLRLSSTLLLGLAAGNALAASPDATRQAECAVWQRELSFAQSVADHDAKAFAEHLHADAAFGVSRAPTRGREAITREWAPLIEGKALKLRWYPAVVTLGGDDGTWRVLFDDGVSPQKVDAAAVQRFYEGRKAQCPPA